MPNSFLTVSRVRVSQTGDLPKGDILSVHIKTTHELSKFSVNGHLKTHFANITHLDIRIKFEPGELDHDIRIPH
jgi:hypothetical protein